MHMHMHMRMHTHLQVGHVLARHHAERISQLNVTGLANMLLRAFVGVSIPGVLVMLGMFLPYSRCVCE
jgi:hypothetical protein